MEARKKDVNWSVCGDDGHMTFPGAQLAVLMDVRDELKRLNALLHCQNFQAIPRKLDAIRGNTAKPRKRKAAKRA